jgi:uncharacterized repeat protein (TIGR01451 family)
MALHPLPWMVSLRTQVVAAPLNGTLIYVLEGTNTGNARNIRTIDPTTGALSANIFTTAMTSGAAMAMDGTTNTLYYADRTNTPNQMRRYDGTTQSGSIGTFTGTSNTVIMLRMGFAGATGYGINNSNNVYSFTNTDPSTISNLGVISFQGASPSGSIASGDIAFDGGGHGWAIFGNSLYRMDFNSTPIRAYPIGQITVGGTALSTTTYSVGSIAFAPSGDLLIGAISGTSTTIYNVDVNDATAVQVGPVLTSTILTDFASGNAPTLNPNLVATKTVSPAGNINPGTTLTYTIEIENTGNAPAVALAFQDALPAGTTYVANSATLNGTNLSAATYPFSAATTINGRNASAGALKVGNANRATITYQVTVDTTNPPTSVVNTGVATYLDGPGGGVSTTTTTSGVNALVSGYKSVKLTTDTDSSGTITPGDTLTWTLSYKNTTSTASSNFQINDPLPTGVTITSTGAQTVTVTGTGTAASKNNSYTGATTGMVSDLLATGAVLGASGIITVNIPTTVNTGFTGTIGNQASASGGMITSSTNYTDNVDSSTAGLPSGITVPSGSLAQTQGIGIDPTIVTVVGIPNVTLSKSVNPVGDQQPGADLTYNITYTNSGTAAAESFIVFDPIPTNTDFKIGSATSAPGTTSLTIITEYSNDNGTTWTYTPTSGSGGAEAGYDRTVNRVRWRVTAGTLSQVIPNNVGSVGFTVKIR